MTPYYDDGKPSGILGTAMRDADEQAEMFLEEQEK